MAETTINFKIDTEVYKRVKVKVAIDGTTIKDYVLSLILKDLADKKC